MLKKRVIKKPNYVLFQFFNLLYCLIKVQVATYNVAEGLRFYPMQESVIVSLASIASSS